MHGGVRAPYPACIRRCTLACIFSVNRWDLVGAAPTERKSRIRNNEPREPRGLTRAVKPLWLYSAAPAPLFIRIGSCFFFSLLFASLNPFHRRSVLSPFLFLSSRVGFLFLHIAIYILLHATSREILGVNSQDRTNDSVNSAVVR